MKNESKPNESNLWMSLKNSTGTVKAKASDVFINNCENHTKKQNPIPKYT